MEGLPRKQLISLILEKVIGDTKGGVQRVDLSKDCPSAARERIQIANDTAKMNEKNLRAKEAALSTQIETATKNGDTTTAETLKQKLAKVSEYRTTNLKNMDKLESIASDYALKYKPKDDLYDQRAHSLFLRQQKEKMEARMKEENDAEFPNVDALEKLKRRMGRIDSAQKDSNAWLEKNDPKWIKGTTEGSVDPKAAEKRENEKIKSAVAASQEAQAAAEKAQTQAGSADTKKTPEAQAPSTPAPQAQAPQAQAPSTPAPQAQEVGGGEAKSKEPGSTWKTTRGGFGAMNRGGIVKYFKSQEDADLYAGLERGKRRARKPSVRSDGVPREIKPTKAATEPAGKRAKRKTSTVAEFAAGFTESHLEKLNEVYRDSGLGKWFHGETSTKEPGWDRYNTKGERAGKCGDAKEGEPYAACLSKQKADKLGKKGIASFVRRKRRAQKEAGMAKKGEREGSGKKPVFVSTGIDKVNEASENEPTNPELWAKAISLAKEKFEVYPSAYANAWAAKWYKGEGGGWRKADSSVNEAVSMETMQQGIKDCIAQIEKHKKLAHAAKAAGDTKEYKRCRNIIASRSSDIKTIQDMIKRANTKSSPMSEAVSAIIANSLQRKAQLAEEEKPYKGFVKGKNHPEGGLSRAEAERQGIHAGIETKDEAERKGGFSKLSPKTQKRRKSFCSRMCGMKAKNTSAETAADPDSKINAALRVWGCRC
jgi:hypothetical protein